MQELNKLKSILILGSEGFIGNWLARYFAGKGYNVSGCDIIERPIRNDYSYLKISSSGSSWKEILSKTTYDFCINAAGNGNPAVSMTHPFLDFEANTLETIKILEGIRLSKSSCKYLHLSSAAVYGNPKKLPVTEDSAPSPLSPYGWHKLMAEQLCREYAEIYGLHTIIVRPFSVYGPGLRKQLFWDIHQKMESGLSEIELWGTGNESRDFIYIDELAEAIQQIIFHSESKFELYNVGSGTETTVRDAIQQFIDSRGRNVKAVFNNKTREGDPLNWRADISKLNSIGFQPKVTLKDGLSEINNWLNRLTENK